MSFGVDPKMTTLDDFRSELLEFCREIAREEAEEEQLKLLRLARRFGYRFEVTPLDEADKDTAKILTRFLNARIDKKPPGRRA